MRQMLTNIKSSIQGFRIRLRTKPLFSKFQAQLLLDKPVPLPSKIVFKRMEYPELNRFFCRFFNSKPIDGKVSGNSLAFIVGAQNVGKTEYIQKNIAAVISKKNRLKNDLAQKQNILFQIHKSPQSFQEQIKEKVFDNEHYIIFNLNFKKIGGFNYGSFINVLHNNIKNSILQKVASFQKNNKNQQKLRNQVTNLLTAQILKDVVLHQYASQYIFVFVKDVIYSILEDKDSIYLISKQSKEKLEEFNESILGRSCEYFFAQKYQELIQILSTEMKMLQIQTSLAFFYSVFQRIQYESRPPQYIDSWYQNGIQTSNYLFSILDFFSGQGKYCQTVYRDYVNSDSQTKKQMMKKLNESNNYILQGNHIDVLLCLSNLQNLYCFKAKDKQFFNFIDHIVCRNTTNTNIRKHFPIMIELPNRSILDQFIQLGKLDVMSPVIVQIPGYIRELLKFTNLTQLFSLDYIKSLFMKIGSNPSTWDNMIEQMAKGQKLKDIVYGKCKYQQKEHIKLEAKFNRVFIYEDCLSKLNRGLLKGDLADILWILNKTKGMMFVIRSYYSLTLFKTAPFQALMQQNVLYHRYYTCNMELTTLTDTNVLKKLQKKFKVRLSLLDFIEKKIKYPWMMKHDIKARHNIQRDLFILRQNSKQYKDGELYTTYFGPQSAYDFVYPKTAYQTSGFQFMTGVK